MKKDEITLNEFLILVFIRMFETGTKLPLDERPWHKALQKVSRSKGCRIMAVKELFFNSDGPYQTCPDFTRTFGYFTDSGCLESFEPSTSYSIDQETIDIWKEKIPNGAPSSSIRQCVIKMAAALKFEAEKGRRTAAEPEAVAA